MIEVAVEAPQPVVVEAPQPVAAEAVAEVAQAPDVVVEPAVAATEIAQADAAEEVTVPAAVIEQDVVAAAPVDPAASRAEQLRGLFDTARQDAANAPLPTQEDAAEEATRNA